MLLMEVYKHIKIMDPSCIYLRIIGIYVKPLESQNFKYHNILLAICNNLVLLSVFINCLRGNITIYKLWLFAAFIYDLMAF